MTRPRLMLLAGVVLSLAACGDPPTAARGQVDGPAAALVLVPDGSSLVGRDVVVTGLAGEEVARGALPAVWRPRLRDDVLEVRGLPVGWREVALGGVAAVASGSAATVGVPSASAGTSWVFVVLYVLAAAYAAASIGTTGGPNHGEHPLILCALLLLVFSATSQHWARGPLVSGAVLVGAACLLALAAAARWEVVFERHVGAARVVMAALWIGLLAIHLSEPEYAPRAAWTSRTAFELYVPPGRRGPVELVGADGASLASDTLVLGRDVRALWVWTAEASPAAVRLGDGALVPLDERPAR